MDRESAIIYYRQACPPVAGLADGPKKLIISQGFSPIKQ